MSQRHAIDARESDQSRRASARLRLTTRGKRVIALLVSVPMVVGVAALVAQPAIAASSAASSSPSYETVTVSTGESLWEIAAEITVDRDVRDVVADLQTLNGLHGGHVEPGQTLLLPIDR